jgi:hypothetical protein
MSSFLERGDALYWEKEARRLQGFLNMLEMFFDNYDFGDKNAVADVIREKSTKHIKHFRKIFREE